jgi:hypothetical protein
MWRLLVVVNVADFKCHGCIGVIEGEASSGRLPQVTFGWLPISKTSASSCDSGMGKPRLVPGFAVERSGLYVFVLRRDMVGYHGKSLAIPHRDAARKDRASDLVDRTSPALRIKSKGTQDIPRSGPSAIIVTGNPSGPSPYQTSSSCRIRFCAFHGWPEKS